jgi:hypothetical protein
MSIVTNGYGAQGLVVTRGYGGGTVITEPVPQEICHLTSAIERAIYAISPMFDRIAYVSFVGGELFCYSRIEMQCHLESKITKEHNTNSKIEKRSSAEIQSTVTDSMKLVSAIKCDCKE